MVGGGLRSSKSFPFGKIYEQNNLDLFTILKFYWNYLSEIFEFL